MAPSMWVGFLNPTFGQRPKRCACLVLRTSVGFKNPTYGLPVCILFFRFGMRKESSALLFSYFSKNKKTSCKIKYLISNILMATTWPTTEAAPQAGLLPAQERRKGCFAKASNCQHCVILFFNRKRKMKGRLNRSDGLLVYFKP